MNDAELIVALGDITALADALNLPKSTVANWPTRGIPWRMRGEVLRLARRKRIKLREDFLTAQAPAIEAERASPTQPESAPA